MTDDLQIYEVTNKNTGQKSYQAAPTAQDACTQAGWMIGDCFTLYQKPRHKPIPNHQSILLVKIPCNTCPYQFAECLKPDNDECPTKTETQDLDDWRQQAARAYLCTHTGKKLAKTDYHLGQKWVTMEQAIKELTAKPQGLAPNTSEQACQTPIPTP